MRPEVSGLDHLVLTVADIEATITFYEGALGMRAEAFCPADGTRRWALRFGRQKINLHAAGAEFEPKAARALPGTADLCFLSDVPLEEWLAHLSVCGLRVEDGPVPRSGAMGPIRSIYLRDPDGNLIEISNPVE
ncbi:MAG: VOC family protein [Roseovarius sp.]|uniref:VOC family protein n=1 Tax=Roseovarius sp. TaxID=1486281 RepID=UPI0032EC39E8